MVYFLDTNCLIDAENLHFMYDQDTGFWEWLEELGEKKIVQIPEAVYGEIMPGDLASWLEERKKKFYRSTNECVKFLPRVLEAYQKGSKPIPEAALENLKADPYIIAHALRESGIVVTGEKPNNASAILNKKIPSICQLLNIPCYTITRFLWEMKGRPHKDGKAKRL